MKKRLAIVCTHPIQYYAPFFKKLSERKVIDIKVFYTWGQAASGIHYDHGFDKHIKWDLPLLEGYEFEFLQNTSAKPGINHFKGISNIDITEKIKLYNPSAILIYGWAFQSHLYALRHFSKRIPIFFRGDSTLLDEEMGIKQLARKLFLTWVYKHVNVAFYVGKANYQYYIKFGLQEKQLVFAPHAIENERFFQYRSTPQNDDLSLRSQLSVGTEEFVFLFSGKLEDKKNPDLLMRVFMRAGFPNTCHLVFTGSGILKKELITKSSHCKNIHFLDFQNQTMMPAVYRMGNVYVLPSQGPGETWGLAVNEAMASGRPVIVSDKCGCALDLVEDGINGYIFRSNDENDLLQKMLKIYNERAGISRMGDASSKIIQQYSIDKVCDVVEATVLQVI